MWGVVMLALMNHLYEKYNNHILFKSKNWCEIKISTINVRLKKGLNIILSFLEC